MVARRHKDRDGIVYAIGQFRVSNPTPGSNLNYKTDVWSGIEGVRKIPLSEHVLQRRKGYNSGRENSEMSHTVNIMCRDMP